MYYGKFDEIFDEIFGGSPRHIYRTSVAAKNNDSEDYEINYTKDGSYVHFEVPGFDKSNLKIELEKGIIHIEGKRTYKMNETEKTKTVSKRFNIGDVSASESIEATIENGLLTIFVPNYKKQEKKTINII